MTTLVRYGVLGLALASTGCGVDVQFDVRSERDALPSIATVSIFGVYKDGQLAPSAWAEIGPKVAQSLKSDRCEPMISSSLAGKRPSLYEVTLEAARASGVTDSLLDKFTPAATGDGILVISVGGRLATPRKGALDNPVSASHPQSPGGPQGGPVTITPMPRSFEMTATLFSKSLHKSVGHLRMLYSGQSMDEATQSFADKLVSTFPIRGCAAWNNEAPLDEAAITKTAEE